MRARFSGGEKGITGIETAIIMIAFIVVAAVFAKSILSAGIFAADKGREAVYSGLEEIQGTLEVRGDLIGFKDTLNSGGQGSLGKVEFTITMYSDGGQADLTPAYTIDSSTGALSNTNPNANKILIAFTDQDVAVDDCAWTVAWSGRNNGDYMLDAGEKAIVTVWLHSFDGASWSPSGNETANFLGTHYVDTYHAFSLEVRSAKGAVLRMERTTPPYLDPVINLR